ncbi:glycosyltransferase family 9 protein [Flavobacterium sp. ZB4R12]|uniref:glycosyltransferase family 9 protein n=1 Tax=Flavobacterium sp. ZB4R12 TaxID=3398732 RepID=UPI003AAA6371
MKILVIQQKMIGDVLASSIICNNLKIIYPESQVDYLIYPFTSPVVENNLNIDNLILFKDGYRKSKFAFFKFLLKIKKERYDLVIDAYGKTESNLITLFSGSKKKIGIYKKYSHFIYTDTIKELSQPSTNAGLALENRLLLLSDFNDNKKQLDIKPKIFLTSDEIENGKQILEKNNIDFSNKIYMIGVLGSGKNKTYPFPYMAKVLDAIVAETNATLLFNYMPSQKEEAQTIYNLCLPETQLKIKIDLMLRNIREFLSVTYHCNALIGNEGGAVNMAKALDKPTFTIFSTWIIKEAWNSFENETTTVSVHLKDYKPELYGKKTAKEMKNEALNLYDKFTPDLILPILKKYIKSN